MVISYRFDTTSITLKNNQEIFKMKFFLVSFAVVAAIVVSCDEIGQKIFIF